MREKSQINWDNYIKNSGYEPPREDGLSDDCQCFYEITSVQVDPIPSYASGYGLEFWSTNECVPANPEFCNYFSGLYYTDSECASINFPGCVDIWSALPPLTAYSFDCEIPASSLFDVNLISVWFYDPNDPYAPCGGDYLESTITFRIGCIETCGNYSYIAYSPITTLSWDGPLGGNWYDGSESTFISLDGCGCTPTLTDLN